MKKADRRLQERIMRESLEKKIFFRLIFSLFVCEIEEGQLISIRFVAHMNIYFCTEDSLS